MSTNHVNKFAMIHTLSLNVIVKFHSAKQITKWQDWLHRFEQNTVLSQSSVEYI